MSATVGTGPGGPAGGTAGGPPPLRRSTSDRMIAGVAAGIGRRLTVDPVVVRIAFAALVFVGGVGMLAYVACWLLIPPDEGGEADAAPERSKTAVVAGILVAAAAVAVLFGLPIWLPLPVVALAGLVVLAVFWARSDRAPRAWAGWHPAARVAAGIAIACLAIAAALALTAGAAVATAAGGGRPMGALVVALGVVALALALAGARRGARWLVLPAILVALPTGLVIAGGLEGVGHEHHRPLESGAIAAAGYELAVGELTLDLRDMRLAPGERVRVTARVGLGRIAVSVAPEVCVVGRGEAWAGAVEFDRMERRGVGPRLQIAGDPPARAPVVELDAEVGVGVVQVGRGPVDDPHRIGAPAATCVPGEVE